MTEYVWKLPDGRVVDDRTLKKILPEFLTESLFLDMLDNQYPEAEIVGEAYDAGHALAMTDPDRFRRLYRKQVDEFYDDRNHGSLALLGIDRMRADESYSVRTRSTGRAPAARKAGRR